MVRTRELRAVGIVTGDGVDGVFRKVGAETEYRDQRARPVVGSIASEVALDPPAVSRHLVRNSLHGRFQSGPARSNAALDCSLERGRKAFEGERCAGRDANPPQSADHRFVIS